MKILIALNHPAHYYLFKFISIELQKKGHEVKYVIKGKDILETILINEGINYTKLISRTKNKNNIFSILSGLGVDMIKQNSSLMKYLKSFRPDIMIGTDISISHAGFIKKIPTLIFNEDDIEINKLFCYSTYPFCTHIITPKICAVGRYKNKQISYNGYQKLAYLHPIWFKPDIKVVRKYFKNENPYFLIRLVSFNAGHDIEQKHGGIPLDVVEELISSLKQKGDVYITSENDLPPQFKSYGLQIDPVDIHHLMFFSTLFIGDSQSMIVEAAMLGTPSVRFNSFVGKISVLNELETKYNLTIGINNNNPQLLLKTVENLINTDNLKDIYQERRERMLSDKIDVTAFVVWFVENYPASVKIMKENPEYQERFR
jgi:predicted glycosyltransferase